MGHARYEEYGGDHQVPRIECRIHHCRHRYPLPRGRNPATVTTYKRPSRRNFSRFATELKYLSMNKTVALVNEWADFEQQHPDADIADFCRHYLISQREKDKKVPLEGGDIPWNINGLLLKMMGRINKLNIIFAAKALEGTGID